ncbi:MAG: hypothetical protein RJA63_1143 [Pseudomonadota bacterium]|nr:substrate-binding domain-containing protein [Uliginosibacterium sp.]
MPTRSALRRFTAVFMFLILSSLGLNSHAAGKIAFISPASDTAPWWQTVANGVKDAGSDFNVATDYRYPPSDSVKELAKLIDAAVAAKYDGIIAVIPDFPALKPHLAAVQAAKIPLITVNTGSHAQSESVGAILHIGQPDDVAGRAAGAKAKGSGVKSFLCLNHYAQYPASHQRCQGFAEGLGLKTATELSLSGDPKAMQAQVAAYFAANKVPEALVSLGPPGASAALAVLKTAKAAKAPYFVSFDLSPEITQAIRKGQIAFAIDQQPYLQGYLSVGILAEHLRNRQNDLLMTKTLLYAQRPLHARVSKYGLTLLTFGERHINSGPAFIERHNVEKVETYSGTYR